MRPGDQHPGLKLPPLRRARTLEGRPAFLALALGVEWRTQWEVAGWPLVHVALGRNDAGRLRVAKGIIAIGQFGVGLITVAQFGVGLIFGLGQFILGLTALAQVAVSAFFAVGQVAVGYVAVGQVAVGYFALAQLGWARHLWSVGHRDPGAVVFFTALWEALKARLPGGW